MSEDEFLKAGFDHPCRTTCSGWGQGWERGKEVARTEFDEQAKKAANQTLIAIKLNAESLEEIDFLKKKIEIAEASTVRKVFTIIARVKEDDRLAQYLIEQLKLEYNLDVIEILKNEKAKPETPATT